MAGSCSAEQFALVARAKALQAKRRDLSFEKAYRIAAEEHAEAALKRAQAVVNEVNRAVKEAEQVTKVAERLPAPAREHLLDDLTFRQAQRAVTALTYRRRLPVRRPRRLDRRLGCGGRPAARSPTSTRAGPSEDGESEPPGSGEPGGVTSRAGTSVSAEPEVGSPLGGAS